MQFEIRWIDVSENLSQGRQPVVVVPREHREGVGAYWVPQTDLLQGETLWHLTRAGDFVRVPLHAYRTSHMALSAILSTGMELGYSAARAAACHGEIQLPIQRVHLLLGSTADEIGAGESRAYRVYAGVAFQT